MPTQTYTLINSQVLGSDAAIVSFASLPTNYRDLIIACEVRSSRTNSSSDDMKFYFNNSGTGSYFALSMIGDGSGAFRQITGGSSAIEVSGINTSLSGNTIMTKIHFQIFDYAQTNKHKSFLYRRDEANLRTQAAANRWDQTSAINTVTFDLSNGNFVAGSTFYIYGIES